MKSMLLTALVVGAAIAGLALYYQKKNKPQNRMEDAAKDAYQTMNEGIGSVERPMHHAMG
jgi:multisubunit Na+/H+ antiporter MnhC subunit